MIVGVESDKHSKADRNSSDIRSHSATDLSTGYAHLDLLAAGSKGSN